MTAATRYPDWERKLQEHIQICEHLIFRFGKFDCCLFSADAVLAMTGIDLMESERRKYVGAKAAKMLLQAFGGLEKALECVTAREGLSEISPLFAGRGDLVMCKDRYPICGIVDLSGIPRMPIRRGLTHIPLASCVRAWRVG